MVGDVPNDAHGKIRGRIGRPRGRLRIILLVSGVLLIVVGLLLCIEPVVPQNVPVNWVPRSQPSGIDIDFAAVQVISPFVAQVFQISWSWAEASIFNDLEYSICDASPSSQNIESACPTGGDMNPLANGSVTLSVPSGDYLALFAVDGGPQVNVTVVSTLPAVGLALVAGGTALAIASFVRVRHSRPDLPGKFGATEAKPIPPEPPRLPPNP
jgi:hypothetical protein